IIKIIIASAFLTACSNEQPMEQIEPDKKPNVIYIFADDLGYGEIGAFGQKLIKTPTLDQMAADGMIFTNHYSGSPVCAPSRSTLLEGKHTGHSQIRDNFELGGYLDEEERGQLPLKAGTVTIGTLMQDAGYKTAAIGKWGLGFNGSEGAPNKQGFDLFYGYLDQKQAHNYYPTHLWKNTERAPLNNEYFSAHQAFEGDPNNAADYDKYKGSDYAVDHMTAEAKNFINENKDDPFFLYLAYNIPHVALQVPDERLEEYDFEETPYLGDNMYVPHQKPRAAYAAMITLMDDHIGQILAQLDDLNLTDDTLIMFTSDNGPTYVSGVDVELFNSTDGLRGLKGDVYEGGIRVPMIAKWPGNIKPGTSTDHISAIWDVLPTLGSIVGEDTPDDIDGVSFLPTLLGEENQVEHEALYWEYHDSRWAGSQAARLGKWKAVRLGGHNDANAPIELYNLDIDRAESNDVAADNPDVIARVQAVFNSRTVSEVEGWNFATAE
ncbi:MAG: arylsulfatase, partial [Kordiimonadaceae bacterium]|nr:arylsulfatase [Kordiimonadaceae bacterium]